MFVGQYTHRSLSEKAEVRPAVHIPMVYEKVAEEPTRWEYHVLAIDTRESDLPDADQLNALGKEGWVLTGLLDERATGRGARGYYYFARQAGA